MDSDRFPLLDGNASLLQEAFGEGPVNVAAVRVWNADFEICLAHERMFATGVGALPAQRLESADEVAP